MGFGRLVFAVVGLASAALGSGQAKPATAKAKVSLGFHISHWGHYPETASPTPGHTVHNLFVAFDNDSNQEIASVEVKVTLFHNDKAILTRSPIHIDRFSDYSIMSRHGAIPGVRAFGDLVIPFDLPVGAWSPRDGAEFKILSFKRYAGKQDLHDLGHFATWFKTATDVQVEREFAKDPSLREARNDDGYTPLAVAYLFGTGKQIEAVAGKTIFGQPTYARGMTALHLAAQNPHVEAMDAALARGADVNALTEGGATPLMVAISYGQTDSARWLLRHGADAEIVDKAGYSALRYAVRSDRLERIRLLVDRGVRINGHWGDGFGPLQDATDHEIEPILQLFIAAGISVNDVDPAFGVTPLMAAAKYRSYRSIRWLLRHGAMLDARDKKGRDALAYAKEADPIHGEESFRQAVESAQRRGNLNL